MLKCFSVAKKRVKIGPKNGDFSEIRGLNIKYTNPDSQKAYPRPERRLLAYFA